jgi:hypothetical protein
MLQLQQILAGDVLEGEPTSTRMKSQVQGHRHSKEVVWLLLRMKFYTQNRSNLAAIIIVQAPPTVLWLTLSII